MISKYHDVLKKYISDNHGEKMVSFFEDIYIPNEKHNQWCMRTYSCDDSCPPWMNTYYDVLNKCMHYYRKIDLTKADIYSVIDKLCTDPEMNRTIKNKIDMKSEYEIKTDFSTIEDYIRILISIEKLNKRFK